MRYLKYIVLIIIVYALNACTRLHTTYHAYHTFEKEVWDKRDTVWLQLHLNDSITKDSEVLVVIRNTTAYQYQFIHTSIIYNLPDSTIWQADSTSLRIANQRGDWLGDGFGKLHQQTIPISELSTIPPGNYTFKVSHTMEKDTIVGVKDIGVLIQKKKIN